MRKLLDLALFGLLDKQNNLKEQMVKLNLPINRLPIEKLDEQLGIINRRFSYILKSKVLSDLTSGHVIPVYNEENVALPNFMHAVLINNGGRPVSLVNLGNYGRMDKDGNFNINERTLFSLLQTGTILRETYMNQGKILMNPVIMKNASIAYAKLVGRVLDKKYAINLSKQRTDSIYYVLAKFFLIYVMGRTPGESTNNIAFQACYNDTTKNTVLASDQAFTEDAYTSFPSFVQNLATLDGIGKLTQRELLNEFWMMYDTSNILAMEFFPFFLHMLFTAMVGAPTTQNNYRIDSLVSKESALVYNELGRLIR